MTRQTVRTLDGRAVRALVFVAFAVVVLATMGALIVRHAFLTRGIPDDYPEPIAHAVTRLGVNVYLSQADEDELAETFAAVEEAGFTVVKQSFNYSGENQFDWTAADRIVDAAASAGLDIVPLLDGDPTNNYAPPADPAAFADWAGEFAQRYSDVVDYYIVWDEPNLAAHWGNEQVNADDYAALLSATAETIRSADATATIVAAPLAPTTETNSVNLSDVSYLQAMYEAGAADAFDVAAAKPYGFDYGPDDRRVDHDVLNFSRAVLLREVMERNGDAATALWAGNWGWNALPDDWQGAPSLWGRVDEATQAAWTATALERVVTEWPWMGTLFLENWEPAAPADDPRWGFSIANRPILDALQAVLPSAAVAYPGFHPASDADPAQQYRGDWRFSADYGADSSEKTGDQPRDSVEFRFWGTDLGLRVRRADFRARFYVTVDGEPANALPTDEYGAMLVLDAPDPAEDYITIEPVAANLPPGEHIAIITAERGWGQWALNGFSVAYNPPPTSLHRALLLLGALAVALLGFAWRDARHADWGAAGTRFHAGYNRLHSRTQLVLVGAVAAVVSLTGWLTWGQQAAGAYRRLGDGTQLAAVVATAAVFYVTPTFFITMAALVVLVILLSFRPAWGLALIALTMPFYALDLLKPVFSYRFSPVELFTWAALAGFLLAQATAIAKRRSLSAEKPLRRRLIGADYAVILFTLVATASLFFTARLDPALREWRTVIVGAALLYALLRWIRPTPDEMWVVLDAWVLSAVLVSLIGLGEYGLGSDRITAEGGLFRLRSVYGSPNNVALYFGRILPMLLAMLLLGHSAAVWRRRLYAVALLPIGLAGMLTFSKGGLLLAFPVGALIVFVYWQRVNQRRIWPWLLLFVVVGGLSLVALLRLPPLASRFDLLGETSLLRFNLWRAGINMFRDNFWSGVGLDNFLTAYRGRYIFAEAWREPNLSHPHNFLLDFGTRLGIFGLLAGLWLLFTLGRIVLLLPFRISAEWRPVAVGLIAAFGAMVVHGLVDHMFFLVDLAYVFYLMLGVAVWLQRPGAPPGGAGQPT
ncbi:MAG: O-antigen ligase family protein [Anaerolineae bacterium]|nr:O-antigen ligase family protein [Anaerolineae bacterium]